MKQESRIMNQATSDPEPEQARYGAGKRQATPNQSKLGTGQASDKRHGISVSHVPCLMSLNSGFSLLEMVVAIGIFMVVVWGAAGIVINASDLQIKASELRTLQDNVRFAIEYMSKELRTGKSITTSACSTPPFCGRISFTNDRGQSIMYCVTNSVLIRSIVGNCDSSPGDETKNIHMTSDDIRVDFINFRVVGNTPGPSDGQTMITMTMKVASVPGKTNVQTDMNLQTTVVQRLREVQ